MHPRSRRSNILRYAAISLVCVLGVWAVFGRTHAPSDAQQAETWVVIEKGSVEETVTAQGKLEPKQFVDVGVQVSGQLKSLHVAIGDTVKKGALIAEIDPQIYVARVEADQAQIKTLQAQLAEQQAQAAFAESVYKRNQKLMKGDAVSKEVLQSSEKEYKGSAARLNSYKAQIEQAQSQLNADKSNLGFTKIYAPIKGTVVSQTSKEGQTLNANQQAPVIVQIADLDTMTVRAQVAEADVSRLTTGMDVYFTTLGSERRWTSSLRQLLPSPDATVSDVVLYNALVDVANADRALMTGMSTQMFFLLGSAKDVPVIPVRALGKKTEPATADHGERYEVRVQTKTGVETRIIEIGLMNRTVAQVLSGLAEGDKVAVAVPDAAGSKAAAGASRKPPMPL